MLMADLLKYVWAVCMIQSQTMLSKVYNMSKILMVIKPKIVCLIVHEECQVAYTEDKRYVETASFCVN